MLNYWDLRNTKSPVFTNNESKTVLMSCDFLPNTSMVVTTSMYGEVGVVDLKSHQRTFYYDSRETKLEEERKNRLQMDEEQDLEFDPHRMPIRNKPEEFSNIMYCTRALPGLGPN
jgi:hypothetical protein